MSKSVINEDYVRKQELPPYETSERQLKKQRKVKNMFIFRNYDLNILIRFLD